MVFLSLVGDGGSYTTCDPQVPRRLGVTYTRGVRDDDESGRGPGADRAALALLALGGALRLGAVLAAADVPLVLDEADYYQRSLALLAGEGFGDSYRPPLYPLFLAAVGALSGGSLLATRLAQVALSLLTGWLLFLWVRGLAGRRGALFTLGLFATYPTLVGFTHMLWSETLFLTLLAAFFYLVAGAAPLTGRRAAAAGVVYGLGVLTRSVLLPFLPAVALWVWLDGPAARRGRRAASAAILAAVAVAAVLPWSLRNHAQHRQWVWVETTSGYNLWKGNTPRGAELASGPSYPGPLYSVPIFPYEDSGGRQGLAQLCAERLGGAPATDVALNRCARAEAVAYIVSDPAAFVERGLSKLAITAHPSSFVTRHLLLGWYGEVPRWFGLALIYGTAVSYAAVWALGLAGLPRVRPRRTLRIVLLWCLYSGAIVFTTFGMNRYRLPVTLLLMVSAGFLFGGRQLRETQPPAPADPRAAPE